MTGQRYASHSAAVDPSVDTSTGTFPAVTEATVETPRPKPRALRFPEPDDPAPRMRRMVLLSGWSAALALLGLIVAVRTFIAIVLSPGPGWLVPVVAVVGFAGIACAGLAFAAVHHKWLPWELLSLASLLLGINLILVTTLL